MRTISTILTVLALASGANLARAADKLPEEMSTLINGYAVGRLTAGHLQGICKWHLAPQVPAGQLDQFRLQNSAFCEGFLSASAEFSQLDAASLSGADVPKSMPPLSCKGLSPAPFARQFLSNADLKARMRSPASEFLLSTVFACTKR